MRLPKILEYLNFRKLYLAGLTSELGSFITETALMLTVFELSSQNKSYLGAARAVFLIFLTIGNLVGGSLSEQYNRQKILNFANYLRIPCVLSLFFLTDVWGVIVIDGFIAFFTGIYNPTRQTITNDIVPAKDIPKANAIFGSTFAILHMLGPFLGATLFTYFGGIKEILTFDLLTYAVGIYLIGSIKYKKHQSQSIKKNIFAQSVEGMNYIRQKRDLYAMVSNTAIAGLCIGFLLPLLLPYVIEVLGKGKQAYGVAFSLFGLGGVIGGWLSQKFSGKIPAGKLTIMSICFEPVLMLTWLFIPSYPMTLAIFFLWGIAVFVRITSQLNYVSMKVESTYLSRVFSLLDLSFIIPNITSGIIVSIIGNYFSTEVLLKIVAGIFFLGIFPRLLTKDIRVLYNAEDKYIEREDLNII